MTWCVFVLKRAAHSSFVDFVSQSTPLASGTLRQLPNFALYSYATVLHTCCCQYDAKNEQKFKEDIKSKKSVSTTVRDPSPARWRGHKDAHIIINIKMLTSDATVTMTITLPLHAPELLSAKLKYCNLTIPILHVSFLYY